MDRHRHYISALSTLSLWLYPCKQTFRSCNKRMTSGLNFLNDPITDEFSSLLCEQIHISQIETVYKIKRWDLETQRLARSYIVSCKTVHVCHQRVAANKLLNLSESYVITSQLSFYLFQGHMTRTYLAWLNLQMRVYCYVQIIQSIAGRLKTVSDIQTPQDPLYCIYCSKQTCYVASGVIFRTSIEHNEQCEADFALI